MFDLFVLHAINPCYKCELGGMVDARDLKSRVHLDVRVQVPQFAPLFMSSYKVFEKHNCFL